MSGFCKMSRNKMCYIILALSIVFFLSSVCTYAVLSVTREDNVVSSTVLKSDDHKPQIEQRKIIKRLKRLEERVQKRKKNGRRK